MNAPLILTDAAKSIAKILLKFNDDQFHLVRLTDIPGALLNDFNDAVQSLEDLSFITVRNSGGRVFYDAGETPDDSFKHEFEILLIDSSIEKSL